MYGTDYGFNSLLDSGMKVLIAPDKFKGTLTATQVCDAIEAGLLRSGKPISIKKFPLADGGEGTLEIFLAHTEGRLIEVEVHDPLMRKIKSVYGISNDGRTAYIEMARSSGLELLKPEERNPLIVPVTSRSSSPWRSSSGITARQLPKRPTRNSSSAFNTVPCPRTCPNSSWGWARTASA